MTSNPAIWSRAIQNENLIYCSLKNGPDAVAFSDRDCMWVTSFMSRAVPQDASDV